MQRTATGPTKPNAAPRLSLAHAANGSTTGAHSAPRHGRESKAETLSANAWRNLPETAQLKSGAGETLRSNKTTQACLTLRFSEKIQRNRMLDTVRYLSWNE